MIEKCRSKEIDEWGELYMVICMNMYPIMKYKFSVKCIIRFKSLPGDTQRINNYTPNKVADIICKWKEKRGS